MKRVLVALIAGLALATPSTAVGHTWVEPSEAINVARNDMASPPHSHSMSYNYGCRINGSAFWQRWSNPSHKHQIKVDHDHYNGGYRWITTVYSGWISGWPPAGCS